MRTYAWGDPNDFDLRPRLQLKARLSPRSEAANEKLAAYIDERDQGSRNQPASRIGPSLVTFR